MKLDSTGRGRRGLPGWVYIVSVGLALAASATIVMKNVSLSGGRLHWAAADDSDDDAIALAEGEPRVVDQDAEDEIAGGKAANAPSDRKGKTILMSLSSGSSAGNAPALSRALPLASASPATSLSDKPSIDELIARAKREIAACQAKYATVRDYSCLFHKHERIGGKMSNPHIMAMKARNAPHAVYFKFHQPNKGREAIYIPGKHNGKIVAHEPGMLRLVAGTMYLDPTGTMAMEDNRHPISEAGIGNLIDTVLTRWNTELDPNEALVEIHPHTKVGERVCTMVSTVHPTKSATFLFHKVKLFIDHEHGLPIRFEAYDWPKAPGAEPELLEEYTYSDLKLDLGLTDRDFDPANPHYSYGRF